VHLVGFTIEIYYDARSYKRQKKQRISCASSWFFLTRSVGAIRENKLI